MQAIEDDPAPYPEATILPSQTSVGVYSRELRESAKSYMVWAFRL